MTDMNVRAPLPHSSYRMLMRINVWENKVSGEYYTCGATVHHSHTHIYTTHSHTYRGHSYILLCGTAGDQLRVIQNDTNRGSDRIHRAVQDEHLSSKDGSWFLNIQVQWRTKKRISWSDSAMIMFFDFSSDFNAIQPALLKDKLEHRGVEQHLTNRTIWLTVHIMWGLTTVCQTVICILYI